MNVRGIVQEVGLVEQIKDGKKNDGSTWVLWGTRLIVDGETYGMTAFSKGELDKRIEGIKEGDEVSFNVIVDGKFKNIDKEMDLSILSSGNKTEKVEIVTAKVMTEKEVMAKMKDVFHDLSNDVKTAEELDAKVKIWVSVQSERVAQMIQASKEKNMAGWKK